MKTERKNKIWFWLGMLSVILSFVPYLILKENAIVPYHDQLDGELIAYMLQAKHLFDGGNVIPEFLNGAAKTSLMPPAPLAVLLFRLLPPFAAYLTMQFSGQMIAYLGMYLLAGEITDRKWLAAFAGVLFSFLPFLPLYGLTQYGQPFLLWCAVNLYRNRRTGISFLGVGLYALMSSLVLCGYGYLLLWGISLFVTGCRRKLKGHGRFAAGALVLCAVYVLENLPLLLQMLGFGNAEISHKSEYVISGNSFLILLKNYFLYNGEHSTDYHIGIILLCLLVLFPAAVRYRSQNVQVKRKLCLAGLFLAVILLCCVMSAFWGSRNMAAVRSAMGTLGAFQAERLLWLTSPLWYLLLVCCLDLLVEMSLFFGRSCRAGKSAAVGKLFQGLWRGAVLCFAVAVLGATGFSIVKGSHVRPCIQKVLNPDYNMISWSDIWRMA